MKDTPDQELICLLSQGNALAYSEIYERHWERLYKFSYSILRDQHACKDLIHDVFAWLWQQRAHLQIQSLPSYLKAAVKFKIANQIRSGNIRESFFEEVKKLGDQILPGAEIEAEWKDMHTIIQQAVSNLPDKCREIFKLSREAHLSNREIAEHLGISIKTVENQMTIALHRVKTAVLPHFILFVLSFIDSK